MTTTPGMTIHLDEKTVAALTELQGRLDDQSPLLRGSLTIPVLARSVINSWCDSQREVIAHVHADGGIRNESGHGGWAGDANDPKAAIIAARKANE